MCAVDSPLHNSRGAGECEWGLSTENSRCWCRLCVCPVVCADVYKGVCRELLTRGLGLNTMLMLPLAVDVFLCWFTRWRYNLKNKHPHSGAKVSALQFFTDTFFHFQCYFSLAFIFVVFHSEILCHLPHSCNRKLLNHSSWLEEEKFKIPL